MVVTEVGTANLMLVEHAILSRITGEAIDDKNAKLTVLSR